eukprot:TRINITY_DN79542_c0_g1_i1.p1 TRINITY_DN79542_c0_g1~~TRINITY_DN79542_c0_g1_i1.p1  ORF type:complete len:911 (+),score=183.01 TRINITY_DN79542_c0_g1_i1:49-2733(+)
MELAWLALYPGRPSNQDWKRLDASARIARAALQHGSVCHLLYEDRSRLSLEPSFLGRAWDGSEAKYKDILLSVQAGEDLVGASWEAPEHGGILRDCLRPLLRGYDLLLELREEGTVILGDFGTSSSSEGIRKQPLRTLCVIGGVRDVSPREQEAIQDLCLELKIERHMVSLGPQPELTSKCMKTIGVMNTGMLFANNLNHCRAIGKASSVPTCLPLRATRPHLHLIVKLAAPVSVPDFVSRPAAATMVVDAFVNSHGIYRNTVLSIVSSQGEALTLHAPGKCLAEADALQWLQERLHTKKPRQMEDLLREARGPVRVLLADETRPELTQPALSAAVPLAEVAVAVIFACRADEEGILNACNAAGVQWHARRAVGGLPAGMAYVNILHSAGLLAPALSMSLPTARQRAADRRHAPACPTASRSAVAVRVPGQARAAVAKAWGSRPAPWATASSSKAEVDEVQPAVSSSVATSGAEPLQEDNAAPACFAEGASAEPDAAPASAELAEPAEPSASEMELPASVEPASADQAEPEEAAVEPQQPAAAVEPQQPARQDAAAPPPVRSYAEIARSKTACSNTQQKTAVAPPELAPSGISTQLPSEESEPGEDQRSLDDQSGSRKEAQENLVIPATAAAPLPPMLSSDTPSTTQEPSEISLQSEISEPGEIDAAQPESASSKGYDGARNQLEASATAEAAALPVPSVSVAAVEQPSYAAIVARSNAKERMDTKADVPKEQIKTKVQNVLQPWPEPEAEQTSSAETVIAQPISAGSESHPPSPRQFCADDEEVSSQQDTTTKAEMFHEADSESPVPEPPKRGSDSDEELPGSACREQENEYPPDSVCRSELSEEDTDFKQQGEAPEHDQETAPVEKSEPPAKPSWADILRRNNAATASRPES